MSLYAYMVVEYDYSDSTYDVLFHEKKYTKEEFQKICNEAREKAEIIIDRHYWGFMQEFERILKEEYGFKEIDILEYDTNDKKVRIYGDVE